MSRDRSHLLTEQVNPRTIDVDTLPTRQILERIHVEDQRAVAAVGEVLDDVAKAVDAVASAFRRGGRLVYVGAGTSGRLGVLDAAECPPTFGSEPEMVVGILAGGYGALVQTAEGAEDDQRAGAREVRQRGVSEADVVIGIAAGSTTPFVIGGLEEARTLGATTVFVTCVDSSHASQSTEVDITVAPQTGPEAIAGSTRMKAGTATKLVLNMITTSAMIRVGKTYGNLMVDLKVTSDKLEDRGRRILRDLLEIDYEEAGELLLAAAGSVKTALVMRRRAVGCDEAERMLDDADGFLRAALGE